MSNKGKLSIMKQGGARLGEIREKLLKDVKPGISAIELDQIAEVLITRAGGKPSFMTVDGYKWSTCICINDCIVHGIPAKYSLRTGDLVTIDVGMLYEGYHTDTAASLIVGKPNGDHFLDIGKLALKEAIAQAVIGNRIGHISLAMQQIIEDAGYNVARSLVGHGIGRELHMDPQVPCYLDEAIEKTPKLEDGLTIAIEVIYMEGKSALIVDNDGWTMRTRDRSRAGMFEHTVAITTKGPKILTHA